MRDWERGEQQDCGIGRVGSARFVVGLLWDCRISGLQRRRERRIAKLALVERSAEHNPGAAKGTRKKWGWDCGEGSGCKEEKEDCTGKKRIERRKVQLSPPKAKSDAILAGLQENVSNPVQDWRGGYVKLFGGKDDHAHQLGRGCRPCFSGSVRFHLIT